MSEQMSGYKQMAANTEASIAAQQAAEAAAMVNTHAEANVLNAQIDQGVQRAEHIDAIEARKVSAEGHAINEEADVAVFGSRGRTQGYVDADGKPVTAPIKGEVDEIRDTEGVAGRRENPRYGTKESDREAAADSYEAEQGEKADDYVTDIEELQGEGFELSQAKLIHDLRQERVANEDALFAKLMQTDKYKQMDHKHAIAAAGMRILDQTRRHGDDEALLKQIVRDEGLLNRDEYNSFRYKHGRAQEGERKEFVAYHESALASTRKQSDAAERQEIEGKLHVRDLANEQRIVAHNEGRGPENADKTPETNKSLHTNVYYEAGEDGRSLTAMEVTSEGRGVDLEMLDGRHALITTEDTTYYLNGNYINDLEKMKLAEPDKAEEWKFNEGNHKPFVEVGSPLVIDGQTISGPITKIEVEDSLHAVDELAKLEGWEARGEDPFQKARDIMSEAINGVDGENGGGAGVGEPDGGNIRDRIRDAMLKAHMGMQDRMASAGEYMNDDEKGRRRKAGAILGGLAILGVGGYFASKGISLDGHTNEAAPALSMKPHHHEAAQAVGPGGISVPAPHEHVVPATDLGSGTTAPTSVKLKAGENPWVVSEHQLPPSASNARIDNYDDMLRAANGHMTEEEARNLPVGTVLKLPR